MALMTAAISKKAQANYPMGSSFEQMVVAKFFDPCSGWMWFVMNQDPADPDYLWGIVKGPEVESGSFSLAELQQFRGRLRLGIERDTHFAPRPAREVWDALLAGEAV